MESLRGGSIGITSDYVEPGNIRDIENYFLTGSFTPAEDDYVPPAFTADKSVGRDDLNVAGTRHPDARHILIKGTGGVGGPEEFPNSDIGIRIETRNLVVTSESADIHLLGEGGGMPDAILQGLIENAKDTTPFAGSDRTDLMGMVGNGIPIAVDNTTLINAIGVLYGNNNDGIQIETGSDLLIRAFRNAPTGGATRTVAEIGGNIFMEGTGGLGRQLNRGIELSSGDRIGIISDIGNVSMSGVGGGPSTSVLAIDHPGNGRVDKLLEADFDDADILSLIHI